MSENSSQNKTETTTAHQSPANGGDTNNEQYKTYKFPVPSLGRWEKKIDTDGKEYYFNEGLHVKIRQWMEEDSDSLPKGWEKRTNAKGEPFYVDHNTKTTSRVKPTLKNLQKRAEKEAFIKITDIKHEIQSSVMEPQTCDEPTSPSSLPPPPTVNVPDPVPLPDNWEVKVTTDGKRFFINHKDKTTQWDDPRLPSLEDQLPFPTNNWEMKITEEGVIYFVDTLNQIATFEDPRQSLTEN